MKMKDFFKKTAIKISNFFCSFFPMRNTIIFESNPDLACNSYAVYQEMLKRNYNKKFRIFWRVANVDDFSDLKVENVFFIPKNPKHLISKIKSYLIINRAKINISCVAPVPKYKCGKKQLNIYLDHGSPLKSMLRNGKSDFPLYCDYVICQSDFFVPYVEKSYNITSSQVKVLGVPRNDQLFDSNIDLSNIYGDFDTFSKIVVWVPTFRVSNSRTDCSHDFPYGIPILYSENDVLSLMNILSERNILLIIKPHPACNLSLIKNFNVKNIRILYNKEMLQCGIQTNELLKCSDAMITDYSGIYYDYLLLDKPIGITLDDFDDYNREHGFMFDDPLSILKGFHIRTLKDLEKFIDDIANDRDTFFEERCKIKKLCNSFIDGHSSERVVDFIDNCKVS